MNLSKYEAFLKTAELKSLTKAADALGYTQSGVSHMLNALETELGLQLLQRGRGGVGVTSDGEELLPLIRAVCDRERVLENRVTELRGLMGGTLRVGSFTSVSVQWVPAILKSFRGDYPKIRVEMWNGTDDELEKWLTEGTIDCAFVEIPTKNPFTIEYLARDPILGIMPEGHPLVEKDAISTEDLSRYPFIWEMESGGRVEAWAERYIPQIQHPQLSTTDDYAVMAMVENGLGVSILPELVMQHSDRRIVKKPLKPLAYRDLGIAVNVGQKPSAAAAEFIRHARICVQ